MKFNILIEKQFMLEMIKLKYVIKVSFTWFLNF